MRYLAAKAPAGGVHALIGSMSRGEKTGTLELETEKGREYLYFVDGKLYLRRSPDQRTIALLRLLAQQDGSASDEVSETLPDLARSTAELLSRIKVRSYRFVDDFRLGPEELVGPLPTGPAVDEHRIGTKAEGSKVPSAPPPLTTRPRVVERLRPTARSARRPAAPVSSASAIREALSWPRDVPPGAAPRRTEAETDTLAAGPRRSPRQAARSPNPSSKKSRPVEALSMDSSLLESEPAKPKPPQSALPPPAASARLSFAEQAAGRPSASSGPRDRDSIHVTWEEVEPPRSEHQEAQAWFRHFGLQQAPFSLTPDPGFLFLSDSHAEALAGLKLSLLERRGLCVMTGEVGTGKTTLLYSLFSTASSEIETAFVHNPTLAFDQLLETILRDLNVAPESTRRVDLLDALNNFLTTSATKSQTVAVVIDEAQNLSDESFEFLRLLLNFETFESKLLQIFLVGQPELGQRLRSHGLRQIADRIAVRCRVDPLTKAESRDYIRHRLELAGGREKLFSSRASALVARKSKGIPRRINVLCHNAMLFAYSQGERTISRAFVAEALKDLKS